MSDKTVPTRMRLYLYVIVAQVDAVGSEHLTQEHADQCQRLATAPVPGLSNVPDEIMGKAWSVLTAPL